MKTKFCSESKRAQLQQSSCSLSCHQQRLLSQGTRGVLLLYCSCTSLQLAPYSNAFAGPWGTVFHWKKNLQNGWKPVPLCSHYQGLSTALWAPSHLSLNKSFPLLIFHVRLFYCLYPKSLEILLFTLKECRPFPCLLWQRHKTYQCFEHIK